MGASFGAVAGGAIGALYGSTYSGSPATYANEPGSQVTGNLPSRDVYEGSLDWHMDDPLGQHDGWPAQTFELDLH